MKTIDLILIVACLTEQLKAEKYTVELVGINENTRSLVQLESDPNLIVTFVDEVKSGDTKIQAILLDSNSNEIDNPVIDDPCDTNTSTQDGTLAAILWASLGIMSCPIAAGDYPAVSKFSQTGTINYEFMFNDEVITIVFVLYSQYNERYFKLTTNVHLTEESLSSFYHFSESINGNMI